MRRPTAKAMPNPSSTPSSAVKTCSSAPLTLTQYLHAAVRAAGGRRVPTADGQPRARPLPAAPARNACLAFEDAVGSARARGRPCHRPAADRCRAPWARCETVACDLWRSRSGARSRAVHWGREQYQGKRRRSGRPRRPDSPPLRSRSPAIAPRRNRTEPTRASRTRGARACFRYSTRARGKP